jgi:hypothetical protein
MDIERFEDEDDALPMKHRIAKLIITGVGALMMKELLSVYYDHVLTTRREAKEAEEQESA